MNVLKHYSTKCIPPVWIVIHIKDDTVTGDVELIHDAIYDRTAERVVQSAIKH